MTELVPVDACPHRPRLRQNMPYGTTRIQCDDCGKAIELPVVTNWQHDNADIARIIEMTFGAQWADKFLRDNA